MVTGGAWLTQWLLTLATVVAPAHGGDGCAELARLDAQRAAAMTANDVGALRAVYSDPAQARDDLALVRSYLQRGLRLHVGPMVQLRCRATSHGEGQVRLDVIDRLGPTWVTSDAGERRALPVDRPDRHVVELRLVADTWRIARVTRAG